MRFVNVLLLLIVVVAWGSNYAAIKFGLPYAGPLSFSMMRALLSGAISAPIAYFSLYQVDRKGSEKVSLPV